jgi:NhaP-type Na+/H+ or K+/H+ antiporter
LLVVYPTVSTTLPQVPQSAVEVFILIIWEILIGLALGLAVRFVLSVMQVSRHDHRLSDGSGFRAQCRSLAGHARACCSATFLRCSA